jgi:hypothetical protein
MDKFKLNGGFPRIAQIVLPLAFLPLITFLVYFMVKKPEFSSFVFSIPLILIMLFVVKMAYQFADIIVEGDCITIKKLFSIKTIRIAECSNLSETTFPFTFRLEFKNLKGVFFYSKPYDIWKQVTNSNPEEFLVQLKQKLKIIKF